MISPKKRVSLYMRCHPISPSGYYRLSQYFDTKSSNLKIRSLLSPLTYRKWNSLSSSIYKRLWSIPIYLMMYINLTFSLLKDLTWLNEGFIIVNGGLIPRELSKFHKLILNKILNKKNKLIWDFDDNPLALGAISNKQFDFLSEKAYKIVVTNNFLKSLLPEEYQRKTYLLPTTDGIMENEDITKHIKNRITEYNNKIDLIWMATASSLSFLEDIIKELDDAAKILKENYQKDLNLKVICNRPLIVKTFYLNIINISWTREVAKTELLKSHIGIMPLIKTNFTLGKGGFKLIQYLSAGVPIIGSAIGFNNEVVTKDCGFLIEENGTIGWKDAIISMSTDQEKYQHMAYEALKRYQMAFPYKRNEEFWLNIVNDREQI